MSFGLPNAITANTYGTFAVAVADFDLDGTADIAAVNYGSQILSPAAFVSIYMGNGTGGFTPGSPATYDTQTSLGGGQYLAVGNFDSNPTPDLIVAHASNKVGLLLNTTVVGPSVTINQAASQADPTNAASIVFDVVFSEGVSGFTAADVDLSASTVGGTLQANVSGSGSTYTVTITGMSGTGTVRATIPAAAATSAANGSPTQASTSTDNTVTFDSAAPTVTINQAAGQADPTTTSPIQFTVVFSENVTGFTAADVDLSGSTSAGPVQADGHPGPGRTTRSTVTGMSGNGTVVATIPAGAASDAAGNPSAASTSTDNTVMFGTIAAPTGDDQPGCRPGRPDQRNVNRVRRRVLTRLSPGSSDPMLTFRGSTVGGTCRPRSPRSGRVCTPSRSPA